MGRSVAVAVGCMLLGALSGCGAEADQSADCNARIGYEGNVYRPHNLLRQSADTRPTEPGAGDVLGCAGDVVDRVAVHEIRGVTPEIAVAVVAREWRGIYVVEGTGPDDWPSSIRRRDQ